MIILLDIDGVMIPESTEERKIEADGFMLFNKQAAKNLSSLITQTNASIILTTNHRIIFTIEKWVEIFNSRGIPITSISKINNLRSIYKIMDRTTEVKEWVETVGADTNYVIIDDDFVLNKLPEPIKRRWVMTNPTIGLDDEAAAKALNILLKHL